MRTEIDEKIKEFPAFKEELFEKLYTFFSLYISKDGSIYFNAYPLKSKLYDRIYKDDVVLYWKTRALYYVGTSTAWHNMTVEYEKNGVTYKVAFDCSSLNQKRGKKKSKGLAYNLREARDNKITFYVTYAENKNRAKIREILQKFKINNIQLDETDLEKLFTTFEMQDEVKTFIAKDVKEFLSEQFDLWFKTYVFDDQSDLSEQRIKQLKLLREIAIKIIDFMAKFEDELVKVWNKPRFVLNSNYVITLDRIAKRVGGTSVLEKIMDHPNMDKQIEEWMGLGLVDKGFDKSKIFVTTLLGKELSRQYQFLPLDTKYFKDIEPDILSLFDNLDSELDGWLIHSENYQALNTILPKFKGKVKVVYIDPPYNTGSQELNYKDHFQDSVWLTMLENRIQLAKQIMSEDGIIFTSIGDSIKSDIRQTSLAKLEMLYEMIFGDNYVATFCRRSGIAPRHDAKLIANNHDYIVSYAKNIQKLTLNRKETDTSEFIYRDEHYNERGAFRLRQFDRGSIHYSPALDYPIIVKPDDVIEIYENGQFQKRKAGERIEIWPGGDKGDKRWIFSWSKKKVEWGIQHDYIVFRKDKNGQWKVYQKDYELVDNKGVRRKRTQPYTSLILDITNEKGTTELANLFSKRVFEYPKPSDLIKYLLEIGSNKDSIVLDFFAGSGTTAHAVMKLNKEDSGRRKFILIEINDYFYDVIIPRLKKLAFSLEWKETKPIGEGMSLFFKYYDLEQYEQVLSKCRYTPSRSDGYAYRLGYVFMKDPDLISELESKYANKGVILTHIYPSVDIAESLSLVKGMWIKRIGKDYVILKDDNGNEVKIDYNNIDFKTIKPLIWW
ncbi:MAG: site-specific DNA-methyltransferase [Metallosphaera sp.]